LPSHVFLTGVTGFIAKRIALDLLNAGHSLKSSLRNINRADEVRDAVRPHPSNPKTLDHLTFVDLGLTKDDGDIQPPARRRIPNPKPWLNALHGSAQPSAPRCK